MSLRGRKGLNEFVERVWFEKWLEAGGIPVSSEVIEFAVPSKSDWNLFGGQQP